MSRRLKFRQVWTSVTAMLFRVLIVINFGPCNPRADQESMAA
jgi:hypothetical protein